jgi:hypothetical protein
MKSIVYVLHRAFNGGYLNEVLNILSAEYNIKIISIDDFLGYNFHSDDIILYQTHPDHRSTRRGKFPKDFLEKTDLKFLKLDNIKVLVDTHDDGDHDAFSRFLFKEYSSSPKVNGISQYSNIEYIFDNKNLENMVRQINDNDLNYFYNIPRIKNTPTVSYLNNFNVILRTTYQAKKRNFVVDKDRALSFHYYSSLAHDLIRQETQEILNNLKSKFPINMKFLSNYPESLNNILCEINVPGRGKGCIRHLETLSSGCLMLAHEDIINTYLLPETLLVDGEDYILFNSKNLESKLEFISSNLSLSNDIRRSGYKKFCTQYSYKISAQTFIRELEQLKK